MDAPEDLALGENVSQAFEKLRPLTVELTRNHSINNVKELQEILKQLGSEELQQLQLYILFPLRIILKKPNLRSENLTLAVTECLAFVLQRTTISSWPTFMDLFTHLCFMLDPLPSQAKPSEQPGYPEEVKLEIVRCITALFKSADDEMTQKIYQPEMLPPLGHAISAILRVIENESLRSLQLEAIECLEVLCCVHQKGQKTLLVQVGSIISSSFPGISMTLVKVVTSDPKKGHVVISAGLAAWRKIVVLILGDEYIELSQTKGKLKGQSKYEQLVVERSEDWVKNTGSKVKVLVEKVIPMVTHDNWKVRLSLAQWAETLLLKCQKTLNECLASVLEVLVTLVGDDYGNIATFCQRALNNFQKSHIFTEGPGSKTFVEVLEENLYKLVTQLPRLVRTADDERKLSTLNLFHGYMQLLGPRINCVLQSHSHMTRVAMAMTQILEFDCSHVQVIAEKSAGQPMIELESSQSSQQRPKKFFKHFVDDRVLLRIIDICHLFGCHGNLDLVLDYFSELFNQGTLYRKQAAYCINEILLGTLKREGEATEAIDSKQLRSIVKTLLDEYLAPEHFEIVISNDREMVLQTETQTDWQIVPTGIESASSTSIEELNSNIIQVCVLMEGIGCCSQVEGTAFQLSLMKVIYPLLDKAGSSTAMVSHTALMVLHQVAAACGCSGLGTLIQENSDYLVDSVSLRLRHLERYPRSPDVLKVVLKYTSSDIIPLLKDTVQEIFEALDEHHNKEAILFMRVLFVLVSSIKSWFPRQPQNEASKSDDVLQELKNLKAEDEQKEEMSAKDIRDFFVTYHKNKQIAEGNVDNEDCDIEDKPAEDEQNENIMDNDEGKKEAPLHIKMVEQVVERCCHLMAAPDARLRLLVLRIVNEAFIVLSNNEDILLPLVHKLWSPLVNRFSDDEPIVTIEALETLKVMGEVSGDFIHQRTVKDVLPKLCAALYKQAEISKRTGPGYKYGVAFKLQRAALRSIGPLAHKVKLTESNLAKVVRSCLPYLSANQPELLQKECLQAFDWFVEQDADLVWLILCNVYLVEPLEPPHPSLPAVKLMGSTTRNEYSDNIKVIHEKLT